MTALFLVGFNSDVIAVLPTSQPTTPANVSAPANAQTTVTPSQTQESSANQNAQLNSSNSTQKPPRLGSREEQNDLYNRMIHGQ